MATQTVNVACTQFAMIDSGNRQQNYHGAASYRIWTEATENRRSILLAFESLPTIPSRYKISKLTLTAYYNRNLTNGLGADMAAAAYELASSFSESTVNYDNAPLVAAIDRVEFFADSGAISAGTGQTSASLIRSAANDYWTKFRATILKRPWMQLSLYYPTTGTNAEYVDIYGREANAALRPILIVEYDDTQLIPSQIRASNAPTSGYINPRNAQNFAWDYDITQPEFCYADGVTQASATFYWREGNSGAYTSIAISGNTKNVTIPANTFPAASSIQWYVTGTDSFGSSSQTPVYTLSTSAAAMAATPAAPVGAVEDGSGVIRLEWTTSSSDGYPQDGADLQISTDGSIWTDLASVLGTVKAYDAAAGTFTAGTVYWRVRGYNIDGTAGNWSAAAQFVCVAAPLEPSVISDGVPFATVEWQVEGQQAYRITVDGKVYGPYFGADKRWTAQDYLRDGEHTITVEVQGAFGLWSQPGAVSFTVENSPADPVTLNGSFDRDAALSWITAAATQDFLIYRDGVQIGHTAGYAFDDRRVLGQHSWQVINRLASGHYTASNIVTGALRSCVTAIALLSGGPWIELKLSENSESVQSFSWRRTTSLRHVRGAAYPVLETSSFEDLVGSYDVSFPDVESMRAFEELRGRTVILKSRGGQVLIGCLATFSKSMKDFYISCSFSVQQIHAEDYIDAAGS